MGVKDTFQLIEIKGKYTSLSTPLGVETVKKIFSFESAQKNLPFLVFETKLNSYIGITLARQSSDLLLLIAKKVISEYKALKLEQNMKLFLMQYMLPKDYSSVKLILLSKQDDSVEITTITKILGEIQFKFQEKINKFVNSLN